jgi:hypothetical protein
VVQFRQWVQSPEEQFWQLLLTAGPLPPQLAANSDSLRDVALLPQAGHLMGESATLIGRSSSKMDSQSLQRYS